MLDRSTANLFHSEQPPAPPAPVSDAGSRLPSDVEEPGYDAPRRDRYRRSLGWRRVRGYVSRAGRVLRWAPLSVALLLLLIRTVGCQSRTASTRVVGVATHTSTVVVVRRRVSPRVRRAARHRRATRRARAPAPMATRAPVVVAPPAPPPVGSGVATVTAVPPARPPPARSAVPARHSRSEFGFES